MHKKACKVTAGLSAEESVAAATPTTTPAPPSTAVVLWPLRDRNKGTSVGKGFKGKSGGTIGTLSGKAHFTLKVQRPTLSEPALMTDLMSSAYKAELEKMVPELEKIRCSANDQQSRRQPLMYPTPDSIQSAQLSAKIY